MSRREEIRRVTAELQARLAELEAMAEALSSGLAAAVPANGQDDEEGDSLGPGP